MSVILFESVELDLGYGNFVGVVEEDVNDDDDDDESTDWISPRMIPKNSSILTTFKKLRGWKKIRFVTNIWHDYGSYTKISWMISSLTIISYANRFPKIWYCHETLPIVALSATGSYSCSRRRKEWHGCLKEGWVLARQTMDVHSSYKYHTQIFRRTDGRTVGSFRNKNNNGELSIRTLQYAFLEYLNALYSKFYSTGEWSEWESFPFSDMITL